MKFEHIAIWVKDLDLIKDFYKKYFGMISSDLYINPTKKYASYFLSFRNAKTRFEIMNRPDIVESSGDRGMTFGLAHISISTGNKEVIDELTERIRQDGFTIASEPRITGDGYYESVVLDPEGNYVEITE